ncbi:MAG: hypothetical protein NTY77_07460 [Elusimicrobia bacterium]|nr:hypothetical protein [Elusimicrobiota bacterium]
MQKLLTAMVVVLVLGAAGCTIKRPLLASSASMGPGQEEVVGMSVGKANQAWFLGIPVGGTADYSLQTALKDALKGKADTLINVFADESCFYFPFYFFSIYTDCGLQLTGTAIRYKNVPPQPSRAFLPPPQAGEAIPATVPASPAITGTLTQQTTAAPVVNPEPYQAMLAEYRQDKKKAAKFFEKAGMATRGDIEDYITREKGKRILPSWKFNLDPSLRQDEADFLKWFLKEYTNYQPVSQ